MSLVDAKDIKAIKKSFGLTMSIKDSAANSQYTFEGKKTTWHYSPNPKHLLNDHVGVRLANTTDQYCFFKALLNLSKIGGEPEDR